MALFLVEGQYGSFEKIIDENAVGGQICALWDNGDGVVLINMPIEVSCKIIKHLQSHH